MYHFLIIPYNLSTQNNEVLFFTNNLRVFAITNITVLNFSRSNVKTNCLKNILQKVQKNLQSFAPLFLILVICPFHTFCIPIFLTVNFCNGCEFLYFL